MTRAERREASETQEMRATVVGLLKKRGWFGRGTVKPAQFTFGDLSLRLEPASDPDQPKLIAIIRSVEGENLPSMFIDALEEMNGYKYYYERRPANAVYISEAENEEGNPGY